MSHFVFNSIIIYLLVAFSTTHVSGVGTLTSSIPYTVAADQTEFVSQHNFLRSLRGGSNMECLKSWNPTLATIAQSYANDCTITKHPPVTSGVACYGNSPIGEAIYYSPVDQTSPADATFGFMIEGDLDYIHTTDTCNAIAPNTCDNYKQVLISFI